MPRIETIRPARRVLGFEGEGHLRSFTIVAERPHAPKCLACGSGELPVREVSLKVEGKHCVITGVLLCEHCISVYRRGV